MFFAVNLGHFIINYFFTCNKHASLTAKIRKRRKKGLATGNRRKPQIRMRENTVSA